MRIACNSLVVTMGIVFCASSVSAQSPENPEGVRLKAGVTTGLYARLGESFDGANAGFGGWATVMVNKWGFDIDYSRSHRLETRRSACVDLSCRRTTSGRDSETNSAIGVTALREIQPMGRAAGHFMVGFGTISRQTSQRFDDPALGEQTESTWWAPGPVAGAGVDILMGHFVARAQYRLHFRVERSIHQFRIGLGWVH